jgi:hypothetical protein
LFLKQPPRPRMATGGARALAGRERLAKRLDRPNPCRGGLYARSVSFILVTWN